MPKTETEFVVRVPFPRLLLIPPLVFLLAVPSSSAQVSESSVIYVAAAGIESPSVVVKDVDGDGRQEFFVSSLDGRIHAFDADGVSLPGWPLLYPSYEQGVNPALNGISRSAPTLADLDGDGIDEVLSVGSYRVYAWDIDGTERWSRNEFNAYQGNALRYGPVVADLDRDGSKEVIFAGWNELGILNADGVPIAGWPKYFTRIFAAPAVADLDGDGDLEIVVSAVNNSSAPYETIHTVYHHDGTSFAGTWPRTTSTVYSFIDVSPVIADVDNDGELDVIASTYEDVFVYDRFGNTKPGWPNSVGRVAFLAVGDLNQDGFLEIAFGWVSPHSYLYDHQGTLLWERTDRSLRQRSITIADVGGDGAADYVLADGVGLVAPVFGWIRAYGINGPPLPEFPITYEQLLRTGVTVEDVNGDGLVELVYGFQNGEVHIQHTQAPRRRASQFWPQWLHDPARTSFCSGTTIFQNGFEGGNTTVWSQTAP